MSTVRPSLVSTSDRLQLTGSVKQMNQKILEEVPYTKDHP